LATICFLLPISLSAQVFNGGFEQGFSDGTTLGWSTPDPSGANVCSDAIFGTKAAKAWVFSYYNRGSWISLTPIDALVPSSGGAPVIPTKIGGYYKYLGEPEECDWADISVVIGKRGEDNTFDTLASGQAELKLSARYRYFEFPIIGEPGDQADVLSVQFSPAGRCNNHGGSNCCFLYMDELKLMPSPEDYEEVAPIELAPKQEEVKVEKAEKPAKVRSLGRKSKKKKKYKFPKAPSKPEPVKAAPVRESKPAPAPKPEPKPAAKTDSKTTTDEAAPVEEEQIPTEIQKEIERIRKVQQEEEDKINGTPDEQSEEGGEG
jgi:hypothetical protein